MVLGLIQKSLDPWLRKTPSACVQGLLLAPYNGFGIGVIVQIFFQLSPRKGVELFDAGDGSVLDFLLGAVLV